MFAQGPCLWIKMQQKHDIWYNGCTPKLRLKKYTNQLPDFHNFAEISNICAKIIDPYTIFKEPLRLMKSRFSILLSDSQSRKKGLSLADLHFHENQMLQCWDMLNLSKMFVSNLVHHYELWHHQSKCWHLLFCLVKINNLCKVHVEVVPLSKAMSDLNLPSFVQKYFRSLFQRSFIYIFHRDLSKIFYIEIC